MAQARAARPADALTALLTTPLAGLGLDLERVEVRRAGSRSVLSLALDRDGGVDLDAVTEASRLVGALLDEADRAGALPPAMRDAYTLEVTSRGVDTPLSLPRHWRRSVGRVVAVRRRAGPPVTGRIVAADDEQAELDCDGGPVAVHYDEVTSALVQVEFARAAGGAATSGPGEEDET